MAAHIALAPGTAFATEEGTETAPVLVIGTEIGTEIERDAEREMGSLELGILGILGRGEGAEIGSLGRGGEVEIGREEMISLIEGEVGVIEVHCRIREMLIDVSLCPIDSGSLLRVSMIMYCCYYVVHVIIFHGEMNANVDLLL
jgi:hypothetical protein